MSEAHQKAGQSVSIKPRICCRLCLAPENECVSIYKTSAADKQPLSMKINACVQIKVSENSFFPIRNARKDFFSKSSIIQSFQINLEFEKLSLPWEEKSILSHLVQHYIKMKMRICGKREGDRREKSFISIFGKHQHYELMCWCPPFWIFAIYHHHRFFSFLLKLDE